MPDAKLETLDMAAILLMTLGEEAAARILQHLGPKEVQRVGSAMAALENVTNQHVESVMSSMLAEVEGLTGLGVSSDHYIRSTFIRALGEEKAGGVIDRILSGGNTTGLDTLKWMDARSVSEVIRFEHPQIQAIVVAYLDADHAAAVLRNLNDSRLQSEILMRVAGLETVQPEALEELNRILERQFSGSSRRQAATFGGTRIAADIMNNVDKSISEDLMNAISEADEDLASEIQDLMFIFENLQEVDDRGIQALLREISSETLIMALKGTEEAMQEKIFKNMSKRAAELLRDDLEASGPVRVSDVETAQREILTAARKMADAGEIMLGGGGDML